MPILRPSTDEYDLYDAHYVDRVATDDVLDLLEAQGRNTVATFSEVADERANVRPGPGRAGPGEWSIKEVVGRLCDFERVFGYRAVHFARGSGLALQTFEQDAFVAAFKANARQLADLLAEFSVVRAATVALLGGMSAEMLARRGGERGGDERLRDSFRNCRPRSGAPCGPGPGARALVTAAAVHAFLSATIVFRMRSPPPLRVCNHNHPQVDSNTRECRSIGRASAEELWHTARASQRAWG